MAEGLLKSFDPGLEVHSAGTQPAARVHPGAIQAMAEAGIDITSSYPKSVDRFLHEPFDFVITVCDHANQTCPIFSGRVWRRVHIGFEDPAKAIGSDEEVLNAFRRVRDQIKDRLYEFYVKAIKLSADCLLRAARRDDFPAIIALLRECKLPTDGITDQLGSNYVVALLGSCVVGVAGIEVYGDYGLLRSVAVAPEVRGRNVGKALVENRLEWAAGQHLKALYLLTDSASGYFPRMQFVRVERDQVPDQIQASREFAHVCPISSIVMSRSL